MSYHETIDNYLYEEENEYTQANDLLERVLPEKRDLLRLYFGVGQRWHCLNELIDLFDGERRVKAPLKSALKSLQYSDEILTIYKYLHR